jgi:hypothetical protein
VFCTGRPCSDPIFLSRCFSFLPATSFSKTGLFKQTRRIPKRSWLYARSEALYFCFGSYSHAHLEQVGHPRHPRPLSFPMLSSSLMASSDNMTHSPVVVQPLLSRWWQDSAQPIATLASSTLRHHRSPPHPRHRRPSDSERLFRLNTAKRKSWWVEARPIML